MKKNSPSNRLNVPLLGIFLALIGLCYFALPQTLENYGKPTFTHTATSAKTPSIPLTSIPASSTPPSATPSQDISTYYVSTVGSDANPGSQAQPMRTIEKAVLTMSAGDQVIVLAGNYPEALSIDKSNIILTAEGEVTMRGFWVKGNDNRISGFTITNPSTDFGIRVSGNNNIIAKNDISNTKQDGIWFFGSGNQFIGNHIHDIVDRSKITPDPHADCFQTWGPAENIVFEKNICNHTSTYGSNQIIMLNSLNPPVRNIIFRNNVFIMHDPGYSPMNFSRKENEEEISNIYVVNNTIVHVNGVGEYAILFVNITGAHAINNVFIDYGTSADPYIVLEESSNIRICNNAIYKSDNIAPAGDLYPGDIWIQDPGMVNYHNYDFHLITSSPLIDRGADLSNLVNDDFEDTVRPIGAGYDIGAFEYAALTYKAHLETLQAEDPFNILPTTTWTANNTSVPCTPFDSQ